MYNRGTVPGNYWQPYPPDWYTAPWHPEQTYTDYNIWWMTCPKCSKLVQVGSEYCPNCGVKIMAGVVKKDKLEQILDKLDEILEELRKGGN